MTIIEILEQEIKEIEKKGYSEEDADYYNGMVDGILKSLKRIEENQ